MSNPPIDVQQTLKQALALHQAKDFSRAEALYRRVLEAHPNQPDALHLLGLIFHQRGHSQQALELISRATQIVPTFAGLGNLAEVLRALGKQNDSLPYFRKSLEMNPDWPETRANFGLALHELARYEEAVKELIRACELAPNRGDFQIRLCRAAEREGDPYTAMRAGQRATELLPQAPEAWSNLALAQTAARKFPEAIASAKHAIELAPQQVETYVNLGVVYAEAGMYDECIAIYEKAIEVNPGYVLAHRNLAAMYDRLERPEQSIAELRRTLELSPSDVEAWINLSSLSRRIKDFATSIVAADKAIELKPNHPNAHGTRGFALLFLGRYPEGFAEYEWRWRCDNFTTPTRSFRGSIWDGSDPKGRTILVHSEQGFGDTLQFARYLPMLAERGAKIIFETWAQTRNVMMRTKGVDKVIVTGVKPPEFDWHIPLLSLPKIFGTTISTIPGNVPYLEIDPQRVDAWKEKIAALGKDLKVGLIWAGNIKPDASRTCPIENLAPLTRIEGVTFVSLQKKANARGSEPPPVGMKFVDVSDELNDFADTGAAMMNLDLILTIDTAACHLAGALARPTWCMLNWACDWRWLEEREDCPWYPTMRLFRQKTKGDWKPVGEQVAVELEKLVREKSR